jgi:hypothetical protein
MGMQGAQSWVNAPLQAKTMTIQWLGVGVIPAVALPLPTQQNNQRQVQLPAWSPGAIVTATVYTPEGKPSANADINASISGQPGTQPQTLRIQTDAAGKFTLKGLLPGPVIFWDQRGQAGWQVQVPAEGIADLALSTSATPVQAQVPGPIEQARIWWFPDGGGAPQLLAHQWSNISDYALEAGTGWLWITDDARGRTTYQRCNLTSGSNQVAPDSSSAPTLGMRFPLDLQAGMPGAVTLVGVGARVGITASYPQLVWSPSSVLGVVTGQIDAVPPGPYQLSVDTPRGPVSTEVTVTDDGCAVALAYPPPPADPVK